MPTIFAIGFDSLFDLVFIDEPRVGENAVAGTADPAESGQVDVVQYPSFGIVGDVIAKDVEQGVTCAAGIDDGRHAGAHAENIGINAEGAESFHQMQMDVDQSWRDDATFDVDMVVARRIEIGGDGVDLPWRTRMSRHGVACRRRDRSGVRLLV